MKKVSEVKKELKALGCHEKQATDLLVACGILENDEENKYQVGDIWLDGDKITKRKIIEIKNDSMTHIAVYEDGSASELFWINECYTDSSLHKLLWREPK